MATLVSGKYSLRTLHEEIGLLDRKLAHLRKYEVFKADSDRDAAVARMESKRNLLVRNARAMISEGIAFLPSEVPASLRENADETATPAAVASPDETPAPSPRPAEANTLSQFAGTSLDSSQSIALYREGKKKTRSARAAAADRALSGIGAASSSASDVQTES